MIRSRCQNWFISTAAARAATVVQTGSAAQEGRMDLAGPLLPLQGFRPQGSSLLVAPAAALAGMGVTQGALPSQGAAAAALAVSQTHAGKTRPRVLAAPVLWGLMAASLEPGVAQGSLLQGPPDRHAMQLFGIRAAQASTAVPQQYSDDVGG